MFSMAMTAWFAKTRNQFDVLFGKRAHLLAVDRDDTDRLAFPEHRGKYDGAGARVLDEVDGANIAREIAFVLGHIDDMNDALAAHRAAGASVRSELDHRFAPPRLDKR